MNDKIEIWKFVLDNRTIQAVMMPHDSEILSAHVQRGVICLWAKVYPDLPKWSRSIEILATGQAVKDVNRKFIGTVMLEGDAMVFHVFERL